MSWLSSLVQKVTGIKPVKITAANAIPTAVEVVTAATGGNLEATAVNAIVTDVEKSLASWLTVQGTKLGLPSNTVDALVAEAGTFITHEVEAEIDKVLHISPPQ